MCGSHKKEMDYCHFMMSLLLVLQTINTVYQQNATTFYITSTHGYCPIEALTGQCVDLQTFLSLQLPAYSTSLFFIHGEHYLDNDFSVTNVENFSMTAYSGFVNGYNTTGMVRDASVLIKCVKKGHSAFHFANISRLTVESVSFYECGGSHDITAASMQLVSVGNATLTNSTWLHSRGSAIIMLYSNAEVSNCKFISANCSNCYGGGINSKYSNLTFIGTSTIMGNVVQADGGGMYIFHSGLKVLGNLSLVANTAARKGGGMYISRSMLSSTNHSLLSIRENACEHSPSSTSLEHGCGGGFYISSSLVYLMGHVVLTGNIAFHDSAGGGFMSTSSCTLCGQVDVDNNSALGVIGSGGGLYVDSGFLKLRDVAFNHNIAKHRGGAIYYYHSTHILTSGKATFNHNRAEIGGAVATVWGSNTTLGGHALFTSNLANQGGTVSVEGLLLVTVTSDVFHLTIPGTCKFANNKAELGGAVNAIGLGNIAFGNTTLFYKKFSHLGCWWSPSNSGISDYFI